MAISYGDLTYSSRKSWELLRKLGSVHLVLVVTKEISNSHFKTSNIKPFKQEKIFVNDKYDAKINKCDKKKALVHDFSLKKLTWFSKR